MTAAASSPVHSVPFAPSAVPARRCAGARPRTLPHRGRAAPAPTHPAGIPSSWPSEAALSGAFGNTPPALAGADARVPTHPAGIPSSWPSEAALSGAFGNTEPLERQNVEVDVSGRLPAWLSGAYVRNGPGTYENGTPEGMRHMFDGYAMLLRLGLDGASNSVRLSHRFVDSEAYKAFKETGVQKWREFATPAPTDGALARLAEAAATALGALGLTQGVTDNASVSVLAQGGRLWAMTEMVAGTIEVDPATLSTLGRVPYSDSLRGDLTTAHPALLPNGDVVNLLNVPGLGFTLYRHAALAPGALTPTERKKIATVPHRRPLSPAWIHDFPYTSRYAVIPESPLFFNLGALMLGSTTDFIFLDWAPQEEARLHVVDLETGAVKTYTTPSFFAFHWANAWESEDGRFLHIEGAIYDDPEIVNHLDLKNCRAVGGPDTAPALPRAGLRRLTLDLDAPSGSSAASGWEPLVADECSYGNFVEFPSVHPEKKGKKARYVWGTAAVRPTNVNNALTKIDLEERICATWHEPGGVVGEPTFVPRPGGDAEDDGVVLSVVTQPNGAAALLVLDGRSFTEVARAALPGAYTNGFHGTFIPS